jgi:putative oxidoreductase
MRKNHSRLRLRTYALTLLRITVGLVMVTHGWMKMTDIAGTQRGFAQIGIPFSELAAYLAAAGEFLGGLGLIVGLLTPIAAFGVLAVMLVAIFSVHWRNGLLAQQGGFEYPLVLAAVALFFMLRGAGPVSLDAWLARRRGGTRTVRASVPPGQHPLEVLP